MVSPYIFFPAELLCPCRCCRCAVCRLRVCLAGHGEKIRQISGMLSNSWMICGWFLDDFSVVPAALTLAHKKQNLDPLSPLEPHACFWAAPSASDMGASARFHGLGLPWGCRKLLSTRWTQSGWHPLPSWRHNCFWQWPKSTMHCERQSWLVNWAKLA